MKTTYFAFPCTDGAYIQEGLTKREYFAGQALAGIVANTNLVPSPIQMAKESVKLADSLIKELQKENEINNL